MESEKELTTTLEQVSDYEFLVKFDEKEINTLLMDEPQPLGNDNGPNAAQVLAAGRWQLSVGELAFLPTEGAH